MRGPILTLLLLGACSVSAYTINFDDGASGVDVGNTYSALGVTFSNARFYHRLYISPSLSFFSSTDGFRPKPGRPIVATFSTPVSTVSVSGNDVGVNGMQLLAYDAGGAQVDSDTAFGPGVGVGTIRTVTVTAPAIVRVAMSQVATINGDGMTWDDFVVVPAVVDPCASDSENPVITCPTNFGFGNSPGLCGANRNYRVSFSDNCPGVTLSQTSGLPSGSFFPVGLTRNSFTATDAAGNTASCSFSMVARDSERPTISCPSNINVNAAGGSCSRAVTYSAPTSSDNCPGETIMQTGGLASGSSFSVGTTTNVFQVTDGAGNTASCSFDVVVRDNENPTISCPSNINANTAGGSCSATVTYSAPTSSDNCLGETTVQTLGQASGSSFSVGTTTNVFQVTDAAGNTASCSFDVVVRDNENPTISCPSNINANTAGGSCSATVTYSAPTSSDNCVGETILRIGGLSSGSLFPLGTTTNVFQVTDGAGNTASCSFDVIVADNEFPTITCPADINIDNSAGSCIATSVTFSSPTSSDNCPDEIFTQTGGLPSGSAFPIGTTTNIFEVTDGAGNTVPCFFRVTVSDNENPTISCGADIGASSTPGLCSAVLTYPAPFSTDNCPGQIVTLTGGLASGSSFPVGTTTNTYHVTDAAGNSATCSLDATVRDLELPTISCPGDMIVFGGRPYSFPSATASDNCPGVTVTQTAGPSPSKLGSPGTVEVVEFTATDAAGQSATCTFTVGATGGIPAKTNMYVPFVTDWSTTFLPSDTTVHLELRDTALQYCSESVSNDVSLSFEGISRTNPGSYSLYIVGDQSVVSFYLGDALLCASPFTNVPEGCADVPSWT